MHSLISCTASPGKIAMHNSRGKNFRKCGPSDQTNEKQIKMAKPWPNISLRFITRLRSPDKSPLRQYLVNSTSAVTATALSPANTAAHRKNFVRDQGCAEVVRFGRIGCRLFKRAFFLDSTLDERAAAFTGNSTAAVRSTAFRRNGQACRLKPLQQTAIGVYPISHG